MHQGGGGVSRGGKMEVYVYDTYVLIHKKRITFKKMIIAYVKHPYKKVRMSQHTKAVNLTYKQLLLIIMQIKYHNIKNNINHNY